MREVLKNVIIPLWNSYSFFVTYATIDGASPSAAPADPANSLDRWILSEAARLVEESTRQMDAYDLQKAIDPIVEFIDLTNNWYIRRSRRRFWRSENDNDKAQAYQTLYAVLLTLVKVAAPFIPFITEEIYRNLRTPDMPESVHLCDFPAYEASRRDLALEREMGLARRAVSLGRALRTMHNLKIRQPLKALHLVTRDPAEKAVLASMRELIREEINVKEVVLRENEEELVEYSAKANFKVLGKNLGKDMKEAAARIEALGGRDIRTILAGGTVELRVAGRSFPLTAEGILVTRTEKEHLKVLNEGSLTVALDPELTPELVAGGAGPRPGARRAEPAQGAGPGGDRPHPAGAFRLRGAAQGRQRFPGEAHRRDPGRRLDLAAAPRSRRGGVRAGDRLRAPAQELIRPPRGAALRRARACWRPSRHCCSPPAPPCRPRGSPSHPGLPCRPTGTYTCSPTYGRPAAFWSRWPPASVASPRCATAGSPQAWILSWTGPKRPTPACTCLARPAAIGPAKPPPSWP